MKTTTTTTTKEVTKTNVGALATGVLPAFQIDTAKLDEVVEEIRVAAATNDATLLTQAGEVEVTDRQSYKRADLVLVQIRSARGTVKDAIEEKLNGVIGVIRSGLDTIYERRRQIVAELETPWESAEKRVKGKMADWQLAEKRREEEAERARIAETNRLRQEAERARQEQEEAERRAAAARTEQARKQAQALAADAADRAAELRSQANVVASTPVERTVVKGVGSKVVTKKRWHVVDMTKFIAAVVAGKVPEIALQVNKEVVDAYWDDDRAVVSCWPGVEVRDEVTVTGR